MILQVKSASRQPDLWPDIQGFFMDAPAGPCDHRRMTGLVDRFGRTIEYVRLSVTDRCDLRCRYCLPQGFRDFEEPEQWLTFPEIGQIMRAFTELGVRRIRLTGGEPLSRGRLPELAGRLAALPGLQDLSLSTNATRFRKHAVALKAAGVTRLNVSLDSLDPGRFAEITGGGKLADVLDGLEAARAASFTPIKINMVMMKGINDAEIGGMVRYCIEQGFALRFIETMPVGDTGRGQCAHLNSAGGPTPAGERIHAVAGHMTGGGPARYVQVAGTELRIGFITPISQHFCGTCNRVRLAVDYIASTPVSARRQTGAATVVAERDRNGWAKGGNRCRDRLETGTSRVCRSSGEGDSFYVLHRRINRQRRVMATSSLSSSSMRAASSSPRFDRSPASDSSAVQ
jgi:cyclic pyranopterin phosphate synthase